ncbi:MAG: hypothetical protein JWO36_2140 [Myxococcales bacterium]|nr:hypothetical protein [Myxococcales bacterium]
MIRERRNAAKLTQKALGVRAGIGGKYVSEIERGTRDVPFSTLQAMVEDGLGLQLEVQFHARASVRSSSLLAVPRSISEVAAAITVLPADQLGLVLTIARAIHVDSDAATGTTFTIELPVTPPVASTS